MRPRYRLPFLLLCQIVLLQVISFFPDQVERWYSGGIYPPFAGLLRRTFSAVPFSVGDVMYAVLILFLVRWLWLKRRSWRVSWKGNVLELLGFVAVFYLFFSICWGLNYYRKPLFEKWQIERDYTDQDLLRFTKKLIVKVNAVHLQIAKQDSVKVHFPYTREAVYAMEQNGYRNLAVQYPEFTYEDLCVKESLFSLPLTYMGFGGYLNPFTNEAQVNAMGPLYNFPTTTAHEMAHQLGYASESECNFVGFLASIKNDNLYFQYSGYSFALRYCLRNWEVRNPAVLKELLKTINPGILKNFQESVAFWEAYETFIETGFQWFYDHFLKFNSQKDGMESYSKFVNLMVNYYQEHEL